MNRLTIFGTAALVASALAVPAAATTSSDTGKFYKHMRHHARYQTTRPGNDAADVAGAALGTAGAIAAAPFGTADNGYYGSGYYSYYGTGWNGGTWDRGYSSRNGMVCTRGTLFKRDDGRRHLCQ
jgi:hypothetical protein